MDTNRLPKQALQYKPKGRSKIGRPRKRWKDQLHLEKTVAEKVAKTCTEDGHKQTTKSGYNMYRGWTQTDYQNKHYNINQKDEGT